MLNQKILQTFSDKSITVTIRVTILNGQVGIGFIFYVFTGNDDPGTQIVHHGIPVKRTCQVCAGQVGIAKGGAGEINAGKICV